jgi:hypothetical protein
MLRTRRPSGQADCNGRIHGWTPLDALSARAVGVVGHHLGRPVCVGDHGRKDLAVRTIKFKITGRCVRACVFCPFHGTPHMLEVKDLERFFDLLGRTVFGQLVINGGEATVHPRFFDFCAYLRRCHKGRLKLALGTNLVSFSWARGRCADIKRKVLETFDRLEVGCDDEHRNIEHLERFAPEITAAGIELHVNVMADYCGQETKRRILVLRDRHGFDVGFSETHHFCTSRPIRNERAVPCRKRTRDLLIDSNGDAFYCHLQEMERPLFNLSKVTRDNLAYFLERHDAPAYRFCAFCRRYQPEGLGHALMRVVRRSLARARPMGAPERLAE